MKLVSIVDYEKYKALTVLRDVTDVNPKGGTPDTMRKRIKIIVKLDAAKAQDDKPQAESILFEDAEWEELKRAINEWPWGPNHPDLLAIIDSVLDAKAPPASEAKPLVG